MCFNTIKIEGEGRGSSKNRKFAEVIEKVVYQNFLKKESFVGSLRRCTESKISAIAFCTKKGYPVPFSGYPYQCYKICLTVLNLFGSPFFTIPNVRCKIIIKFWLMANEKDTSLISLQCTF